MPERKSSRARKSVDYARFGTDDLDDDFADSTPPPSKKQKSSNKENRKLEKRVCTEKVKNRASPKQRPSRDEKAYEKELQLAMELSLSQSPSPQTPVASTETPKSPVVSMETSHEDNPIVIDADNSLSTEAVGQETAVAVSRTGDQTDQSDQPAAVQYVVDDQVPGPSGHRQRRAASKPSAYIDSGDEGEGQGSDYAASDESDDDGGEEEDSDYEDDNDSDFEGSKKKKKEKAAPKAVKGRKQTAAVKQPTVTKSTPASKVTAQKASVKKTVAYKSPSVSKQRASGSPSPAVVAARKSPHWSAPGSAGSCSSPLGGVSIKSPSGALRIGLSRNQRLKPLHPNLKMQN